MSRVKLYLAVALVLPLLFFVLSQTGMDKTLAQIVVFPLVVLLLFRFSMTGIKIPYAMLLFACAGTFLSFTFTYPASSRSGFLVSRLRGDEMQTESRKFRERLNFFLQIEGQPESERYHGSFKGYDEVAKFLRGNKSVDAVVWGDQRWLNVGFHLEPPLTLGETALPLPGYISGRIQVVRSVSNIGMSFNPVSDTALFLAQLAEGIDVNPGDDLNDSALREVVLLSAGTIVAPWTSFSHRSYVYWALGNGRLYEVLNSGVYQRGGLACAEAYYQKAGSFLRRNDNPELQAAIYNNLAVINYLRYLYEGDKRSLKTFRKLLLQAAGTASQKSLLSVPNNAVPVARSNLADFKQEKRAAKGVKGRKLRKSGQAPGKPAKQRREIKDPAAKKSRVGKKEKKNKDPERAAARKNKGKKSRGKADDQ